MSYRDQHLTEFDLELLLKRRPGLILIDEMAHTNAPGLRHGKRWQDIKELLDRGIDVYTTLNVQHIESLNDVVSQIIHARIKETVPDSMLEMADTIELVDLPPEDLLKRLQEGKVYFPEQAELAVDHFFRKGNLIALRELALRATAERVGAQVLLYRQGQGIQYVWPTKDKILVCVGPGNGSTKLIRAARRMATNLQAEWLAVYVDIPRMRSSAEKRNHAIQNLRLAEQLGAETQFLTGFDVVKEIMNFAHEQNITMIMVWKPIRSRVRDFIFRSFADELTRHSGEIDIYVVTNEPSETSLDRHLIIPFPFRKTIPWRIYGVAIVAVLVASIINYFIYPYAGTDNIIMVYLLTVTIVALFGRVGPSILASAASVFAYGYFFLPPYYSFDLSDFKYVFTLCVMLLVTQVISHLTVLTRRQAEAARLAERHTASLHTLSRQLASTRGVDKLLTTAVQHIGDMFDSGVLAMLPDNNRLKVCVSYKSEQTLNAKEDGIAQWVYDLGQMAGLGTDTLPYSDALYVPLHASQGVIGVLRVRPLQPQYLLSPEQMRLLEACANQIALAIEVDRLQEQSKWTEYQNQSKNANSALLKTVSHDLRTPLVSVMASASTLMEIGHELDTKEIKRLSSDIYFELEQLNRLIHNLLQMTYLEIESVKLQIAPHSLQDFVNQIIIAERKKLGSKPIQVKCPVALPDIAFDTSLLHEVFINLIDNAIKFTPPESPIEISMQLRNDTVLVSVEDRGPGISPDEVNKLFEKFYRGRMLTTTRGLGLGLALCHSIVKAHGGEIWAENRPDGGAAFRFTLLLQQ